MVNIDINFIANQIDHWLSCLPNSYLGSDYGIDLKQYLHKPLSSFDADNILRKMRQDIPILSILSDDELNIYSVKNNSDQIDIFIEIKGNLLKAT